MQKFEYEISVQAPSQGVADQKMKALVNILNKLTTEELLKVSAIANNPVLLAQIKNQLV
jgi:hypothetical protein